MRHFAIITAPASRFLRASMFGCRWCCTRDAYAARLDPKKGDPGALMQPS
jgi:hypothetical protein